MEQQRSKDDVVTAIKLWMLNVYTVCKNEPLAPIVLPQVQLMCDQLIKRIEQSDLSLSDANQCLDVLNQGIIDALLGMKKNVDKKSMN